MAVAVDLLMDVGLQYLLLFANQGWLIPSLIAAMQSNQHIQLGGFFQQTAQIAIGELVMWLVEGRIASATHK